MKLFLRILLLILITNCLYANEFEEYENVADQFLKHFTTENFSSAGELFSDKMKGAFPISAMKMTWNQLQTQYGIFSKLGNMRTDINNNYIVVSRNVVFANDSLEALITLEKTAANKILIAGLFFRPTTKPDSEYIDADYVDKNLFDVVSISLPPDDLLKGELTIPSNIPGNKKIPFIVLVHGSGPQDMDVTINDNKVFRDIAYGLSSRGIAVLRYNKRTLVDKNIDASTLTINEETVDDAVSAVNFIFSNYDYIVDKVYVLGHSFGGYSLPLIAGKSEKASGFISLAGSSRNLPDMLFEQYTYLADLQKLSAENDEMKKNIDSTLQIELEKIDRVKKGNYNLNTQTDLLPLNMPPKYLLFLQNYHPTELFLKEKRPVLFLHFDRDYQVTIEDFNLWKNALSDKSNCKFVILDNLNHIMQIGRGKSVPNEYLEKKNVDRSVIDAIEKWIIDNK